MKLSQKLPRIVVRCSKCRREVDRDSTVKREERRLCPPCARPAMH